MIYHIIWSFTRFKLTDWSKYMEFQQITNSWKGPLDFTITSQIHIRIIRIILWSWATPYYKNIKLPKLMHRNNRRPNIYKIEQKINPILAKIRWTNCTTTLLWLPDQFYVRQTKCLFWIQATCFPAS